MSNVLSLRFRVRRRTAASWAALNEVLLDSEIGFERDTQKLKIGDGATAWQDLEYVEDGLDLGLLRDVNLSGRVDGSTLVWNSSSNEYQHSTAGGATTTVVKATDESRASTSTASPDSELKIHLEPGVYHVEAIAFFDMASGSTANLWFGIGFTGTASIAGHRRRYTQTQTTSTDNESTRSAGASSTPPFSSTGITGTGPVPGNYASAVGLIVTVGGEVSLDWAQNSSSATASLVLAGSMLRVTRA